MQYSLEKLAVTLADTFPELSPVAPLRFLGEGFSSVVVETAGGVVFRIGKTSVVQVRYRKEARVLPLMQGSLPAMIPQPQWYIAQSEAFPHGLIGYVKLPGAEIDPEAIQTGVQAQAVAAGIGQFIAALQRIPAGSLGLRDDFEQRYAEWQATQAAVMPVVRETFSAPEYDRIAKWWDAFLLDRRMGDYVSVLVHGDLWYGNILAEGMSVIGVLDFEQLAASDPAADFVPQLYLGKAFLKRVLRAFADAGGMLNAGFAHRLRQLWIAREFGGLHYALEHDPAELVDAVMKIRNGGLLHPTGLDGWRQVWAGNREVENDKKIPPYGEC